MSTSDSKPLDDEEAQRERALQAWELVVLDAPAPPLLAALRGCCGCCG